MGVGDPTFRICHSRCRTPPRTSKWIVGGAHRQAVGPEVPCRKDPPRSQSHAIAGHSSGVVEPDRRPTHDGRHAALD